MKQNENENENEMDEKRKSENLQSHHHLFDQSNRFKNSSHEFKCSSHEPLRPKLFYNPIPHTQHHQIHHPSNLESKQTIFSSNPIPQLSTLEPIYQSLSTSNQPRLQDHHSFQFVQLHTRTNHSHLLQSQPFSTSNKTSFDSFILLSSPPSSPNSLNPPPTSHPPASDLSSLPSLNLSQSSSLNPSNPFHQTLHLLSALNRLKLYSIILMLVSFIQFLTVLVILISTFKIFRSLHSFINLKHDIISAYLLIFILALVLSFILVLHSLHSHNVILLVAVCGFNLLITAYSAVLPTQIQQAFIDSNHSINHQSTNSLQIIPIVMLISTCLMASLTSYFHREFGWDMYKQMGASVHHRRVQQQHSILSIFQTFSSFFFLGALIQFLVLNQPTSLKSLYWIIGSSVLCLYIMTSMTLAVKWELRWLLLLSHLGSLLASISMIYTFIKFIKNSNLEFRIRHTITFFLLLSFLNLIFSILISELCAINFGLINNCFSTPSSSQIFIRTHPKQKKWYSFQCFGIIPHHHQNNHQDHQLDDNGFQKSSSQDRRMSID